MKCSAHHDIVNEVMVQMASGMTDIKVDTSLGILRDRVVGWVVRAIDDIDNKDLILKVSRCCFPLTQFIFRSHFFYQGL
jgi:hypothetical protein